MIMVQDILDLFVSSVYAVGNWFTSIMAATGMESVYLVYLFVFFSVSILIIPVIAGRIRSPFTRGSDQARKRG